MNKILIFLSFIIFVSCSKSNDSNSNPSSRTLRQYADNVIGFSTEYNPSPGDWSAFQTLGKENTYPNYGDIETSWAHRFLSSVRENLVLGFDSAQTVNKVEIYETYNPGCIDTVYLRNATSKAWITIYAQPAVSNLPSESRIFSISITETTYLVDAIRIALNTSARSGWKEIDAVAITGKY